LKIGIIGGGIIGSSLFRILSKKHDVRVLDPGIKTQFPTLIHSLLLKGDDVELSSLSLQFYEEYGIARKKFTSYTLGKIDERVISLWRDHGVEVRETYVDWIREKALEAKGGDSLVNIKQLVNVTREKALVEVKAREKVASIFSNKRDITNDFDIFILAAGSWNSVIFNERIPLKPYYCWASAMKGPRELDKFIVYDYVLGFYSRPMLGIGAPLFIAGDGDIIEMTPPKDGIMNRPPIMDMETVISKIKSRFSSRPLYVSGNFCEGTPDMRPLYGRLKDNLYIAGGLNGYGAEVGPGLAVLLSRLIDGEEEMRSYLIDRFKGIEDFDLGREAHEL
jgi:glycine/D-amino acid oxidase-like deaminating enzyme